MSSSDPSGATPPPAAKGGRRRRTGGADPEGADAAPRRRSGGGSRRRADTGGEDGPKKRGKALPILLGALGAAVVALVGVLVWNVMAGGAKAPEQARPTTYSVYDSESMGEVLASQEVDSRPLSEGEMFERDNKEIDSQGIVFELSARSLTEDCSAAVWGDRVVKALEEAGCTQAASAGYVSDDYVGAVVLFNLRDTEASQAVADAMEQPLLSDEDEESPGFIVTPGEADPLTRLGAGFSRAEASVNGHYLMVSWAQDKSSEDPTEREDLTAPLIALNSYQDPLYRRVVELERPEMGADQGAGSGQESTGAGQGTDTGTGAGAGTGANAGQGGAGAGGDAATGQGTGQGAGTG